MRLIQDVSFGQAGNDRPQLGGGWSDDEPGYRWMIGPSSELWLENPGADAMIELEVSPFVRPPALPAQRFIIQVDGELVGAIDLRAARVCGFRLPASRLSRRRDIRLVFLHPDAARPSDFEPDDDQRALAANVRRISLFAIEKPVARGITGTGGIDATEIEARTGSAPAEFLTRFESLGDNCEFGLVQRRAGAEPLGLLRFSNLEAPQLLRALASNFDGIDDPGSLGHSLSDGARREHVIRAKPFSLVFHTFQYEGEVDQGTLLPRQARRLGFLRRKLLEDLALGEKIFVVRRNPPLAEDEILPVMSALSRHGPGTLLWITLADSDHPPGTVEIVFPGLLRGYLDRIAPDANAHDLSYAAWLEVAVNAASLATLDQPALDETTRAKSPAH